MTDRPLVAAALVLTVYAIALGATGYNGAALGVTAAVAVLLAVTLWQGRHGRRCPICDRWTP